MTIDRRKFPHWLTMNIDKSSAGPVRVVNVTNYTSHIIRDLLPTTTPASDSCIKKITPVWGMFDKNVVLITDFNPIIKCNDGLAKDADRETKSERCFECLCAGKCTDEFMINAIARNLFPEKYKKTNQR